MRIKATFAFFMGINTSSLSTVGQSVISRITSGMDRAPVMDMGFRRDEKGGSGGVFVK
jgi:hypothetical protein